MYVSAHQCVCIPIGMYLHMYLSGELLVNQVDETPTSAS